MERVDSHTVSADPASGRPAPPKASPAAVVKLLEQWMAEDEVEQRETFEILRRALDERRPADCKLFP